MDLKIAIVDDSSADREYIRTLAESWGSERKLGVSTAAFPSAESFLFAWDGDKSWDVLLLDIEMGSTDGFLPCDSNDYVAWAAYQMMLYRVGQCHNFAGLLTVLLGHLGYDCRLIDGVFLNRDGSAVEHKWNYVLLDGKYYWLDVRMDHANYERTGKLNHTYFLIEDTAQWEKKHSWDRSYSDAMMECAELMVETYGLMLEIQLPRTEG